MIDGKTIIACLLLCWSSSASYAQVNYPSTQYQRFGQKEASDNWATSPPAVPDPGPGDDASMSPDSWSSVEPGRNQGREVSMDGDPSDANPNYENPLEDSLPAENLPEANGLEFNPPDSVPAPSVPDLGSISPFSPSSFSRIREPIANDPSTSGDFPSKLTPTFEPVNWGNNSPRYPLSGGSVAGSPKPTVPNSEAFGITENWYEAPYHEGATPNVGPSNRYEAELPTYRPDLGHRSEIPTYRSMGSNDIRQESCFDNNRCAAPSIRETLATGRYFGNVSALYLQPAFQGNTAISIQGPGLAQSIPFDFDYEVAPQFQFGFQSKNGRGLQFDCWQYDETSNATNFISDGTTTGSSSTWLPGPNQFSRLAALNTGEQLDTSHTIDVEVFGVSFFQEIKCDFSRLNGVFGFQYSSITQTMDSILSNGGGAIDSLTSRSDVNGWGPKFALEGYQTIGNTRMELFAKVGGAVLFGHRDQLVANTSTGVFNRVGADEFVTTIDCLTGIQYQKMTAENRSYYARLGVNYQTWIGGGTAVDPQADFGLRGFSFGVGYNR